MRTYRKHSALSMIVALHRAITECRAWILYRGTNVASDNEPNALAQRG